MLYECKDDYVLLSKDLSQLENFISLNELQIENRGKVNYSFIGNDMNYVIAPLILIVFVEKTVLQKVLVLIMCVKD